MTLALARHLTLRSAAAIACLLCCCDVSAAPAEHALRALGFNLLYDAKDNTASLRVISEADADFVCLREMTPRFVDLAEARLAKQYPYRALYPKRGTWGAGLLEAVADVDGRALQLSCLHLFPPVGKHKASDGFFETMAKNARLRRDQAQYLMARYKSRQPLLVFGDMNEEPGGEALLLMATAGLQRACETAVENHCGSTWPGPAIPLVPAAFEIDHILGRGVQFLRAQVIKQGGSDHFPVLAVFQLAGGRP
jgi:endonuclease/exonuclease/phosphatase (EEP) superfamily protein YafD